MNIKINMGKKSSSNMTTIKMEPSVLTSLDQCC